MKIKYRRLAVLVVLSSLLCFYLVARKLRASPTSYTGRGSSELSVTHSPSNVRHPLQLFHNQSKPLNERRSTDYMHENEHKSIGIQAVEILSDISPLDNEQTTVSLPSSNSHPRNNQDSHFSASHDKTSTVTKYRTVVMHSAASETHPAVSNVAVSPKQDKQKTRGYVVAQTIYEQQTMAAGNLFDLQCWAGHMGLLVVKPFMVDSRLFTPLNQHGRSAAVKLEDIFDIDDWAQQTTQYGYSQLTDWDDFIKNAPRKVIYIQMRYPLLSQAKIHGTHYAGKSEAYQQGCKLTLHREETEFLDSYHFHVVRRACFNFVSGDRLTLEQFSNHLFGEYHADDVTVILNEWKGIGASNRVLIANNTCSSGSFRETTKPSRRIVDNARRYAEAYLGGGPYLAVMTRFEMAAMTRPMHDPSDPYKIIPHCMKLVMKAWQDMKTHAGINSTFLAIDIGKYGSLSFFRKKYYNHLDDMKSFVSDIYGDGTTVSQWEKTFEDVAYSTIDGYIAMLQLVIVTRAKCVLFMGGGAFQRHALNVYKELHPKVEDHCIFVVKQCTSPNRGINPT